MGRRGPQPTPTAVLKGRGSWRGETRKDEPEVEVSAPDCPAWVTGPAREHWDELASMLAGMGVMADVHQTALGLLVDALGRYVGLKKVVEKVGETAESSKGGLVVHPAVGEMGRAWDRVLKVCREFGMTPASLSVVKVIGVKKGQAKSDGIAGVINPKLAG